MKHGFIKVAAATPDIKVADVEYNTREICRLIDETAAQKSKVTVFPELCITGYTCGDFICAGPFSKGGKTGDPCDRRAYRGKDGLYFVGAPLSVDGALYNVAAAVSGGKVLGFTTKTFLPNYGEFYEMRHFRPGPKEAEEIFI